MTDRRRVEETLKEAVKLLETIFSSTRFLLAYLDADFNFVRVNEAFAQADHKSAEDFPGKNHFDLYPHDENKAIFRQVVKTGIPYSTRAKPFTYPDHPGRGTTYWDWNLTPVKDVQGTVTGVVLSLDDVTKEVVAAKELRDKEHQYRVVFESTLDGIIISDLWGTIIDANPQAHSLFGYEVNELIGRQGRNLVHPDSYGIFCEMEERFAQRESVFLEHTALKKDGTEFFVDFQGTEFRYRGEPHLLAVVRDITERKKIEQRLKERELELANKNVSLQEINTALDVLLKRRDADREELEKRFLANIEELVKPYLEKLTRTPLNQQQRALAEIMETNLKEVISSFVWRTNEGLSVLTLTEIQIADLIRQGKTTKEIAAILDISNRTIETHRKNIRKKLGLRSKGVSLRSYLLSAHGHHI